MERNADFDALARAAFEVQIQESPIYSRFAEGEEWKGWSAAPFLPVEAFKWPDITGAGTDSVEAVFTSSGTGGRRSVHPVVDLDVYRKSVTTHFEQVFGSGPFTILAQLPTYRRVEGRSSLITMIEILQRRFGSSASRFAEDRDAVVNALEDVSTQKDVSVVIFGTAFGLLDMIDSEALALPAGAIVVETGGMKTYRREISRSELHERLARGFGVRRSAVYSEYGMCELLSQCYTRGGAIFYPPTWMRFKIVDVDNPDEPAESGRPGLLAVYDLANIHSVSPILTSDLAIDRGDGFELLGRADMAEIRGCNFLMGDP